MDSGGQRSDCEDGARRGRAPLKWLRVLMVQGLLLTCLSPKSVSSILAFDDEAKKFCVEDCLDSRIGFVEEPCNTTISSQKKRWSCDMTEHQDEVFHINANDGSRWHILRVMNASTVKLEATKLANKIYLSSIPKIVLDSPSSRLQSDGFIYLSLEECRIEDKYTLSFGSLNELHIDNSQIGVIKLVSINEIDIINGSRIKKLYVGIESLRSTFQDSILDMIEMLHIQGSAKLNMINMTILDMRDVDYRSSDSSTVSSSYIKKISSVTVQPSGGTLEFNNVTINEIAPNGITIMGKVKITDTVVHKAPINGIVLSGEGEIMFSNATINGVQLSITLKADASSNATVSALHLSVITPTSLIVCRVIIPVLGVIVLVLLCFAIKLAMAKWKSNAGEDLEGRNPRSNDADKAKKNYYTKTVPQDIPLTERNERNHAEQLEDSVPPPDLSLLKPARSADSFDVPDIPPPPPPPPQTLPDSGTSSAQPLYVDVGDESENQNSFLHGQKQHNQFIPLPNVQATRKPSPTMRPEFPLQPPRPLLPCPSPEPGAGPSPAPVSLHYATRGAHKPPPPPRNPPTHRKFSQTAEVQGSPFVEFHPPPVHEYQDTADDEPIYASEDDLKNYK